MGEPLLSTLISGESHHPSTLLSMDPTGMASSPHDDCEMIMQQQQQRPQMTLSRPPDINLPLSAEPSPPPQAWSPDPCELLEVGLGPQQLYETDALLSLPRAGPRRCARRGDSIWGAWFFFTFYFRPVLAEKSKGKLSSAGGGAGFDKVDLRLDVFLVQHDMENMYMWMQLRSYMNGHSRPGEPHFPFSADKGFVRSHRMQRKQYRGLSNPQCLHGIEIVRQPNLAAVPEADRKRWAELTGRDAAFAVPLEASDFGLWRNLPTIDFELDRHHHLPSPSARPRRLLTGPGLNLSNGNGGEFGPACNKRRKEYLFGGMEEDCCLSAFSGDAPTPPADPPWLAEFSGVMKRAYGPVTAAKTIYEDEEGYLIVVSLPFADLLRVKVSWKNTPTHGVVKILCVSTARMPYVKRHDRTFKLTDPSPEHCPPGEFVREIPLATRIPEDAQLEAFYDESSTVLEIVVPKHRAGPEEHEVRVCLRPHLGANEFLLA
ncbi:unnamed protein product [Spirodela intermedia]|uniref:Uncharacterized protein n=1 Tax=Spirodela intermedia TaxID=51605 RepID=A0A7I8IV62_SPIIN|nr:unnamed protein product [Spirodela intermedia]CAA6661757.1 unnamed protein product [Spirodela intermedia]